MGTNVSSQNNNPYKILLSKSLFKTYRDFFATFQYSLHFVSYAFIVIKVVFTHLLESKDIASCKT